MDDDAPDASRHERRRRRRRRPADSIGHSSRHVVPIIVLAAATTSPRPSAALPCGDTPMYVSPVGLTCSEHASLGIGCEAFGSVGLSEDEVNDLLRNCPHGCNIPGGDSDCNNMIEEAGGEYASSARILQSNPAGTCYEGCQDTPSFRTKYLLTCENHQRLDCESFAEVGFSEQEVFDLVVSCPCSCRIPCGTYTEAPSASPSSVPTDDFYRCDNPRCQDDPEYRSKLSLACESHARFDCTTMGAIGYSEEEVSELIRRCPCSCRTICSDLFLSEAPTPQPSISASSEPSSQPSMTASSGPSSWPSMTPSSSPSSRPSVKASSSPSSQPSVGMSTSPSWQPSVGMGWSPSSRPSVAVGTSSKLPKAKLAMESSSDVVASISDLVAQWGQRTTSYPTKSPVTLEPTPNPSMPDIAMSSMAKSSHSPISRSPTDMPATERPSHLPTLAPIEMIDGMRNKIDEHAEVNIIGRKEEYPGSDSSVGDVPGNTDNPSKALPVLATLFALTIIGGALFALSKKYPERFSTIGDRLHGAMERVRMILRVAKGDNLADIVLKDNAEDRDVDLARSDSFGSAKSSVTFAKDLVTVYEIPSSIPVRRSVSFADSFGEELATEMGPEPADCVDEEVVIEFGPESRARLDDVTAAPGPGPAVSLDDDVPAEPEPEPPINLDKEVFTKHLPMSKVTETVPVATACSLDKKVAKQLGSGPRPEVATTCRIGKKVDKKPGPGPPVPTTYILGEKVSTELGLGSMTSLDEIDDYLDLSSSRSSADRDLDTESSGSLSMGTYDSADNSIESNPGPLTLRAYVGKREISIPLPGIFSPPSPRGAQSDSWDDTI